MRWSILWFEAKFDLRDSPTLSDLAPFDSKMGKLINLGFRFLQHLASKLREICIHIGRDAQRCPKSGHVAPPRRLAPMKSERAHLVKLQCVTRAKAKDSLAVQNSIGLRLLDEVAGV